MQADPSDSPFTAYIGDRVLRPGAEIPRGSKEVTYDHQRYAFGWEDDGRIVIIRLIGPPRDQNVFGLGTLFNEGDVALNFVMRDGKVVFSPGAADVRSVAVVAERPDVRGAAVFKWSGVFRSTAVNYATGLAALGIIKAVEQLTGEKLNGWVDAGIFAGTGVAVGTGAAWAAGQSIKLGLLGNLAAIPSGLVGGLPIAGAVSLFESEVGIDPAGTGGQLFNIGSTGLLAAAASQASLPAGVAAATGFASAAEAGVSLVGVGLSWAAGAAVAAAGVGGYLLGTGVVNGLDLALRATGLIDDNRMAADWTGRELAIHARDAWDYITGR